GYLDQKEVIQGGRASFWLKYPLQRWRGRSAAGSGPHEDARGVDLAAHVATDGDGLPLVADPDLGAVIFMVQHLPGVAVGDADGALISGAHLRQVQRRLDWQQRRFQLCLRGAVDPP